MQNEAPTPTPEPASMPPVMPAVALPTIDQFTGVDLGQIPVVEATPLVHTSTLMPPRHKSPWKRWLLFIFLTLLVTGGVTAAVIRSQQSRTISTQTYNSNSVSQGYNTVQIPLSAFNKSADQPLGSAQILTVNGQLSVSKSIILAPINQPTAAQTGQLYYDKTANQLRYFNGTSFVSVIDSQTAATMNTAISQALGLATSASTNTSTLAPVTTGVLSLAGQTGAITLGAGLNITGSQVANTGVLKVVSGSASLQVTRDNTGTVTITSLPPSFDLPLNSVAIGQGSGPLAAVSTTVSGLCLMSTTGAPTFAPCGIGNVTTTGGISGTLAKFDDTHSLINSLVSENTTTVTANGNFNLTSTHQYQVNGSQIALANLADGASVCLQNSSSCGFQAAGTYVTGTAADFIQNGTTAQTANFSVSGSGTAGVLNAQTSLQLNGLDINTAGTLNNVAYLNQPNLFSSSLSLAGSLTVSSLGAGLVQTSSGGVVTSSTLDRNSPLLTNSLTVANGGTGLTSVVANGLLYGTGGTNLSVASPSLAGQLLLANASGVPTFTTISGDLTVTDTGVATIASGSVTNAKLATSSLTINTGSNLTGGGSVALGGSLTLTVVSSPSFAGSVNTTTGYQVAGGAVAGQYLRGNGTNFVSSPILASDLPGSSSSYIQNGTVLQTTADFNISGGGTASILNATTSLRLNGADINTAGTLNNVAYLNQANSFSGNLTISGANSLTTTTGTVTFGSLGAGLVQASSTGALSSGTLDRNSALLTGSLSVANGGTGQASLTANGLLYGNGTGNVNVTTVGTAGQLLVANASSVPTFTTVSGDLAISATGVTTIQPGAVTNTKLANSSLTVAAGSNLTGGGVVALGGSVTLNVASAPSFSGIVSATGYNLNSTPVITTSGVLQNVTTNASIITTGAVGLTHGGTGLTTVPSNGQLLVSNGSGYLATDLLAGPGITMTTAPGSITLGVTGVTCDPTATTCTYTPSSSSSSYIQNGTVLQTTADFNISGGGTASIFNATTSLRLNGADINTAGTLNNVAYLNQANVFSGNLTVGGANSLTTGTGSVTFGSLGTGLVQASSTGALSSGTLDRNSALLTGSLSVANGGTGQASLTANGLLYGNGTGTVNVTTVGTAGQLLVANASSVPTFTTVSGDLAISATGVTTIQPGAVTNTKLANSSLTVAAGSNLTGGGSVALGGSVTLNVASAPSFAGIVSATGYNLNSTPVITTSGVLQNVTTDASIITTGAVGLTHGGTGLTTVPSNGQLLVSNGSGYLATDLLAGPGITMTTAPGSITLAVTGVTCDPTATTCTYTPSSSSSSYIQNGTVLQTTADFNISGGGTASILNATTSLRLNGADINTAGTLNNVAYLNQANVFSGNLTISGANSLTTTTGTVTFGSLGAGLVQASSTGALSSGTLDRNSALLTGSLSVANGGTGQASLTANGLLYGNGTGTVNVTTVGTAGQLLAANASSVPTFTTVSGDLAISATGVTTIQNGVVTNTKLANSSLTVAAGSNLTGGGSVALGGSVTLNVAGAPSFAGSVNTATGYQVAGAAIAGQYLRGNGTNFVSSVIQASDLPSGSGNYIQNGTVLQTGNFNISGGGTASIFNATTSLQLNGTNINTAGTLNNVAYLNQANVFSGNLTISGTSSLTTTSGAVTFGSLGTGIMQTNSSGNVSSGTLDRNSALLTGSLSVANGGTGQASLTANGLLYGNGTGSLGITNIGTAGQILLANGSSVPTFTTVNGDLAISATGAATIQNGVVTNAKLANSSLTVTAGTNLAGGGTVALGSSVTLTVASAPSFAGSVNTATGYQVAGSAASGQYLRGNGTNFVSSAILAGDIPSGSANYIQNGTVLQTGNFNISGTGSATSLQANSLDRAATGSLAIGATTATAITLGQAAGSLTVGSGSVALQGNTTVSAGHSLTVTSGGLSVTGLATGTAPTLLVDNSTSTGNILTAQDNGTVAFTIANGGTTNLATGALQTNGTTRLSNAGDLTNIISFNGQSLTGASLCLSTANCGIGAGSGYYIQNGTSQQTTANFNIDSTGTANLFNAVTALQTAGISRITGTGTLQNVSANANILTSGTLGATLLSGSYTGVTGTGALSVGSIASGFGAINTGNNITTSGLVQGATINATTALQTNGTIRLDASGNLTNIATITSTGNAAIGGTLTVTGATTLSSNLTVNGGSFVKGANQHYDFGSIIGATAGWFKLGTLSLPQGGEYATIKLYGGSGFNAIDSQEGHAELYIRTSNSTSTTSSGFGATAQLEQFGNTAFASQVKLVSNVAGASATAYDVYVYTGTFVGQGYYTVDSGSNGAWLNTTTTATDPGANSATVWAATPYTTTAGAIGITLTLSAAQSVPTSTTTILWDSEISKTSGITHSTSSDTGNVYIATPGYYSLSGTFGASLATAGDWRNFIINVNTTVVATTNSTSSSNTPTAIRSNQTPVLVYLNAGDAVHVDTTGNDAGAISGGSWFTIQYVGQNLVTNTSSGFIQNTTALQTGSNFNIDGTGTAGTFNATTALQTGGTTRLSSTGVLSSVTADASILTTGTVATAVISGVYGNITGTGALAAGSIASGFGAISTANTITTTATIQGGTVNATTGGIQTAGTTRITSAGALQNVTADTGILTTGTLAIARGGTGVTTAPANGQLLIGNGTGYTLANLTAGNGITITNTAGGITVAVIDQLKPASGRGWSTRRGGTSDAFPAGTMVGLMTVILPSNAPAGLYMISANVDITSTIATTSYLRVNEMNGTNLSADIKNFISTPNSSTILSFTGTTIWGGGSGGVNVYVQVDAGSGTVYNPETTLYVTYIGP